METTTQTQVAIALAMARRIHDETDGQTTMEVAFCREEESAPFILFDTWEAHDKVATRWPRAFALLEDTLEFSFTDEYEVSYEHSEPMYGSYLPRAFRTEPNHFYWQRSHLYDEGWDIVAKDDDPYLVLEALIAEAERGATPPASVWDDYIPHYWTRHDGKDYTDGDKARVILEVEPHTYVTYVANNTQDWSADIDDDEND